MQIVPTSTSGMQRIRTLKYHVQVVMMYIMCYSLSQIQRLDRNLLALRATTPYTGNGKITQNNERWHIDFMAARYLSHQPRKKTPGE